MEVEGAKGEVVDVVRGMDGLARMWNLSKFASRRSVYGLAIVAETVVWGRQVMDVAYSRGCLAAVGREQR